MPHSEWVWVLLDNVRPGLLPLLLLHCDRCQWAWRYFWVRFSFGSLLRGANVRIRGPHHLRYNIKSCSATSSSPFSTDHHTYHTKSYHSIADGDTLVCADVPVSESFVRGGQATLTAGEKHGTIYVGAAFAAEARGKTRGAELGRLWSALNLSP